METYNGHVRTPNDAVILFEACRLGLLPRVQRRLSEKERQQIKSGSVFVWDEREAGMRRWTDGKSWSASRVSGSFLTYREMEGKRGGSGFAPSAQAKKTNGSASNGSKNGDSDMDMGDDGPDGYRYKPDGLMKQSFSITTNDGRHLHLISYYARSHPTSQPLKQPSTDPALRNIVAPKGMYPESSVNEPPNVPAVTRGPMGGSPYATSNTNSPYAHPQGGAYHQGYAPPPPGYPGPGWPASPMNTPPTHCSPHYPGYHPPPYGHSPLQHGHPAYPPHAYSPASGRTQFDRPPPPLASVSGLPPPPPQPHMPHEAVGRYPGGHAPHYPPPASHYPLQPPPQYGPQAARVAPNPYGASPDPRFSAPSAFPAINASAPTSQPAQVVPAAALATNGARSSQPTKHYISDPLPAPSSQTATNGTSAPSRVIPTIGALINGSANGDGKGAKNTSRAGTNSPANMQRGARDIPGEKIGAPGPDHGEDRRALRQLDKVFANGVKNL